MSESHPFPIVSGALLAAVAAMSVGAMAASPARAAYGVSVTKGVIYGTGAVGSPAPGKASLPMDIYRPVTSSRTRRPVVVLVHGGGFEAGSRADDGIVRSARALAARGVIAASIDYRLKQQAPVPSKSFMRLANAMRNANLGPAYPEPDPVAAATQDAFTALGYLRGNASKLRIKTSRIGLIGSSAGAVTVDNLGYVASGYGVKVPKLRFVASLWGALIVPAPGAKPAVTNLRRGDASLFLVHGDADKTVPVQMSDAMYARAGAERVPVEYYRIAGGGHAWTPSGIFTQRTPKGQPVFDRMIDFAVGRLR